MNTYFVTYYNSSTSCRYILLLYSLGFSISNIIAMNMIMRIEKLIFKLYVIEDIVVKMPST